MCLGFGQGVYLKFERDNIWWRPRINVAEFVRQGSVFGGKRHDGISGNVPVEALTSCLFLQIL